MAPVALASTHSDQPAIKPAQASTLASTDFSSYVLSWPDWDASTSTPASRSRFISQLRRACAGIGFFYLRDSPLDEPGRRDALFELNRNFFELGEDKRRTIEMERSRSFRGYSPFAAERTQGRIDHRDQIDYGPEVQAIDSPSLLASHPFLNLYGPNQFLPDSILPGHRRQVLEWFSLSQQLSNDLTAALEEALELPAGQLSGILEGRGKEDAGAGELERELGPKPYARMKTIRYPNAQKVDGIEGQKDSEQGVGAHKDGGWITLLATDDQRGLQVQDLSGRWIDVPRIPGCLIVNFGQQLERTTHGLIQAATHRVVSNVSGVPRFSIAFFSTPSLTSVVRPIPSQAGQAFRRELERANDERRANGVEVPTSDVPQGDLWGGEEEPFGVVAWSGIVRSHPNVYDRWHAPNAPKV